MKDVVYLFAWPVMPSERERYGFDELARSGVRVRLFDLSAFLSAGALASFPLADRLEAPFIERLPTFEAFERALREAAPRSVFIDYLLGLAQIDARHERVYRALHATDARLWVIAGGGYPAPAARPSLATKLRRLADPRWVAGRAIIEAIAHARSLGRLYPLPDRIFGAPGGAMDAFIARWRLPAQTAVPSHSLDFDAYLRLNAESADLSPNGTAVFLDEAATHHPDVALVGGRNLERKPYEAVMGALFERIEKELGLRVVIAAHPRSRYELYPGAFGGREIARARTPELVGRGSLVIAHASTAVSFAVLFERPVILVETGEMGRVGYDLLVAGMGRALGVEPVRLDAPADAAHVPLPPPPPGPAYERYRYRYVQARGVPEETVWSIVTRQARLA